MEENKNKLKEFNKKGILENNKPEKLKKTTANEKFEEIKAEVEPILKTLDNDYSIEEGEGGILTIVVYGKNNEIVACVNEKETKFFNIDFEQKFLDIETRLKELRNKVKVTKEPNLPEKAETEKNRDEILNKAKIEDEAKNDEKNLKNKNDVSKENIKKELGDDYVVSAEINDEEISKKFNATEGFIGNPLIAYNKKTNKFVIIGNDGTGKLKEATLLTVSAQSSKNVDKYNYDGSIVQEKGLVAKDIMLLPPENNDGIDLRINEYGEIEINKIVNLRGDNPQSFPIDTKQRVPSSSEISDMKANGEKLEEITNIIDELEAKNVIDNDEKNKLMEELATNGMSIEEDKEILEDIKKEKEENINQENAEEKSINQKDEEEIDESWIMYGRPRSH